MAGLHAACHFAAVSLSMGVGSGGAEKHSRPVPPFCDSCTLSRQIVPRLYHSQEQNTHTLSHTYSQPVSLYQSEIDRLTGDCSLHYCFWQEMLLLTNKDSIRLRDEHFVLGQRTVLFFSLSSDSLSSLSNFLSKSISFSSLYLSSTRSICWSVSPPYLGLSFSLFFSLSMCCVPAHRPFPPCSLQPTAETQLQWTSGCGCLHD